MTSEIISFENYLPDGDLGIETIVLRLGKMLAAIPNASISNPLVYHWALSTCCLVSVAAAAIAAA